jgi:hypothetical protein
VALASVFLMDLSLVALVESVQSQRPAIPKSI